MNDPLNSSPDAIRDQKRAGDLPEGRLRHEAATLLNVIVGYSELLLDEAAAHDSSESVAELDNIRVAGRKLQSLINSLSQKKRFPSTTSASPATVSLPGDNRYSLPSSLLIVDDNQDNRDLLARRLAQQGHRISAAENGREALEMLRAQSFDLL